MIWKIMLIFVVEIITSYFLYYTFSSFMILVAEFRNYNKQPNYEH